MFKAVTGIWYEGSPRLIEWLRTFAPKWVDTLSRMLEPDPSKRPESAEALPEDPLRKKSLFAAGGSRFIATALRRVALVAATVAALALVFAFVVAGGTRSRASAQDISSENFALPSGRISMRTAMHVRRLVLPPRDGIVEIAVPEDFSGVLISADEVDGDLHDQIRVVPQPGIRVLYRGNREVVVKRQ